MHYYNENDSAQWDWVNATESAHFMAVNCKWSPSMFHYIYAACIFMQSECEVSEA